MNDSSFLKAIHLSIDTVNKDYKNIRNMFIHSLKTEILKVLKGLIQARFTFRTLLKSM